MGETASLSCPSRLTASRRRRSRASSRLKCLRLRLAVERRGRRPQPNFVVNFVEGSPDKAYDKAYDKGNARKKTRNRELVIRRSPRPQPNRCRSLEQEKTERTECHFSLLSPFPPVQTASRRGLTLAELLIVLAILAVVAGLVLPAVGRYVGQSRDDVTRQSLLRLRDVIAQTYWEDSGRALPRPADLVGPPPRENHPQLRYLFINPATEDAQVTYDPAYRRGWRGPYVVELPGAQYTVDAAAGFSRPYGETGDPAVPDGWGRPVVLQRPGVLLDGRQDVRLVSAGPDGILTIPPSKATALLSDTDKGDDVWLSFEVR